jgi:hypothetical protein
MAPAHATVDSTRAKFLMPGTSSLTTCAAAAVAASQTAPAPIADLALITRMTTPPGYSQFTMIREETDEMSEGTGAAKAGVRAEVSVT